MDDSITEPRQLSSLSSSPRTPFYIRHRVLLLLLITLIGAVFRFAALDHPVMWGDEALTYSRVIGSFGDLVDILRHDPFVPLHYEVYFWLHKGMPIGSVQLAPHLVLTPRVMRFVPALCGTVMIPAIYFAARQLCSVRASLAAAGFACVSAYMMAYSHDAKMYVQTWFFVTLNIGCVWWWLRTGSTTAWLAWVASGAAAVGFHIAAGLMIAPQLLFLLTAPHTGVRNAAAMVIGLLLIAAGPIGYYQGFNQWNRESGGLLPAESSDTAGQASQWKDNSGIGWVEDKNRDVSGPALVRGTAAAYLIGTEWTDAAPGRQYVSPQIHSLVVWATSSVLVLLALGALPWRMPWRGQDQVESERDPSREPAWRILLWLTLLLIVPVYGFYYCRSIRHFATPDDWWNWVHDYVKSPLLWISVAALLYFSGYTTRQRVIKTLRFLLVAAAVIGLCSGIAAFWQIQYARHWAKMQELYGPATSPETRPDLDWMSLWMPRYVGVAWPALAIAAAALLMRLPTRWFRVTALVVLLGINATNAVLHMTAGTWPPHPRMFGDVAESRDSQGRTRIILSTLDPARSGRRRWFDASNYGHYGDIGRYYACIYLGLNVTPTEFRTGEVVAQYRDYLGDLVMPAEIPGVMQSTPSADRLIVWERYFEKFDQPESLPADDDIVRAIGEVWTQARPAEIYRLKSWYDWGDMGWARRREFVKAAGRAG
jgi:hypothetical protein